MQVRIDAVRREPIVDRPPGVAEPETGGAVAQVEPDPARPRLAHGRIDAPFGIDDRKLAREHVRVRDKAAPPRPALVLPAGCIGVHVDVEQPRSDQETLQEREVVALHDLEGYTAAEIAAMMDAPATAGARPRKRGGWAGSYSPIPSMIL